MGMLIRGATTDCTASARTAEAACEHRSTWRRILLVFGPGLAVMLADTDAGSVVTAAQSGAQWGSRLLALQVVLIPVLFIVQELTVRLGIITGRGHGELIKDRFGAGWAWLSVSTLLVACTGATITELSGLAGVGLMFGLPAQFTITFAVAALLVIVWTGSYRSVERIAIAIGACELAFLIVAWRARPAMSAMAGAFLQIPIHDSSYLYLAAANVGAVIMPWMVFYQQSAVVDKRLRLGDLRLARWDTAAGAIVTQIIMAAVLVASAATVERGGSSLALSSIQSIASSLTPFLGDTAGRLLFALGVSGSALLAAIVVSLTAAWGLGEVTGYKRSLEHRPSEAPWFYAVYTLSLLAAAAFVLSGANLLELSVAVEVMNALLLPVVLGFLYVLARRVLPEAHRLRGWYAAVVAGVMLVTAGFGVFASLSGIFFGH